MYVLNRVVMSKQTTIVMVTKIHVLPSIKLAISMLVISILRLNMSDVLCTVSISISLICSHATKNNKIRIINTIKLYVTVSKQKIVLRIFELGTKY